MFQEECLVSCQTTVSCCHLLDHMVLIEEIRKRGKRFVNEMSNRNTLRRMDNLNDKKSSQEVNRSLSPSPAINQIVVSSRQSHTHNSSRHPSMRSTSGVSSSNFRVRQPTNGHSSIQMEPGLQALLVAEARAASMIATARVKRNELMRQAHRESQTETEIFRRERAAQYQLKLHEATQIEQFQTKLGIDRYNALEKMKENVRKERKSLVRYIIHSVVDQIPVGPHPNTKHVMF